MHYADALGFLDAEKSHCNQQCQAETSTTELKTFAEAALQYLQYLLKFWMQKDLWSSWSSQGRKVASLILNVSLSAVIPTTNHLEAFNFSLKFKYISNYKRNCRHRLRFDYFILIVITKILPSIYHRRQLDITYAEWIHKRFSAASGGKILDNTEEAITTDGTGGILWWKEETQRDEQAKAMSTQARMSVHTSDKDHTSFSATCASMAADIQDPNHIHYDLVLHRSGFGTCTCPDFHFRGGACKHLRTLRMFIDSWTISGKITHAFHYPSTFIEAVAIAKAYRAESAKDSCNLLSAQLDRQFQVLEELQATSEPDTNNDHEDADSNGRVVELERDSDTGEDYEFEEFEELPFYSHGMVRISYY